MNTFIAIAIVCLICDTNGARILGIFPVPAQSHYILGSALMRGLAEAGHDVTLISPYKIKNPPKNGTLRDVILTGLDEEAEKRRKERNLFQRTMDNPFLMAAFVQYVMLETTEFTLNHTNVQTLIHSKEQFDLVIVEQFMIDALKGFATHFKAPLILFSTIGANSWINLLVGNPSPPSYIPAVFLSHSTPMTLYDKTLSSLMYVFTEAVNVLFTFPKHAALVKKYFPPGNDLYNVLYNPSIVLVNSHTSTNQPVPYVPSMIDIGGFHVQPPKKLPEDLQRFLDNATEGVIYFSLGSNLKSSQLPVEKREAFLRVFAKLKEQVLWKWEEDVLPGQPENVKLGKWLPQQDILAHPNVKLFITHGGLLSTTEAVYHGVPALAIPVFGDQMMNARNIVKSGFGLTISYHDLSEEILMQELNKLISDKTFTNNAKRRSRLFHDRLNSPMSTAVYWTEYVIRHKGAPHLKVAGVDLPLYQYFLVDVIVVISLIVVIAVKCVVKIIQYCRKQKAQKEKTT